MVFFFGQGLWLSCVRVTEPNYVPTIWYNLKRVFNGQHFEEKKNAYSDEDHWAHIEKSTHELAHMSDSNATIDAVGAIG